MLWAEQGAALIVKSRDDVVIGPGAVSGWAEV
jgi:hypothetical protein